METRRQISLGFTSQKFPEGQHLVYIYNDDDERKRVISKFLDSGFMEQEKVLCLVDTISPEEMKKEMQELGVDIEEGRCALKVASDVYTPEGCYFSSQDMLDVVDDFYNGALSEGYTGTRGTAEMTWALRGNASIPELMVYEAKLTEVLKKYPHTGLCQYDARKFSGAVIMDILTVHPVMIVKGQIVKNPYFTEPGEFLQSYRERLDS